MKTLIDRFEQYIFYSPDGCWYWIGAVTNDGRGRINVNCVNEVASRVSYRIYVGEIIDGLFVCHSCDNKLCVNPNHLWLGTNNDNVHDRDIKGRGSHGENHPFSILTERIVLEIRDAAKTKPIPTIVKDYSLKYKCDRRTIYAIIKNENWKHLLNPQTT